MTERTQTRGNAYRWGMLMWFNQLLLEQGAITEAEFRQMRLAIERKTRELEKGGTKGNHLVSFFFCKCLLVKRKNRRKNSLNS